MGELLKLRVRPTWKRLVRFPRHVQKLRALGLSWLVALEIAWSLVFYRYDVNRGSPEGVTER